MCLPHIRLQLSLSHPFSFSILHMYIHSNDLMIWEPYCGLGYMTFPAALVSKHYIFNFSNYFWRIVHRVPFFFSVVLIDSYIHVHSIQLYRLHHAFVSLQSLSDWNLLQWGICTRTEVLQMAAIFGMGTKRGRSWFDESCYFIVHSTKRNLTNGKSIPNFVWKISKPWYHR